MDKNLYTAADELAITLNEQKLSLSSAESCTAGLVGMAMCAASSGGDCYSKGFITYDDNAKIQLLDVKSETLHSHSAVSSQTVSEMAVGAKCKAGTETSLAISGYAGPEGGEDGTPAGTIWFCWITPDNRLHTIVRHFSGDSNSVVLQAAIFAINQLNLLLKK